MAYSGFDVPAGPAPRLSVAIPVYNAARFLPEAMESVLGQSYADFEVLVIDDGSTDGSGEIIRGFAARDARIRVSARENRSLSRTVNELIEAARGELVARMDSDDICLPGRFERQVRFLDENPSIGVVGSAVDIIDEAGRPIFTQTMPLSHAEIDANHLAGVVSITHPTVMLRRQAAIDAGLYRTGHDPAQDVDLWLRMAETVELANLPEPLLRYRLSSTSVSASRLQLQEDRVRVACEYAWRRRGLPEQPFLYRQWRPGPSRTSRRDFALQYAWQAWNSGHRATFRHYARQAVMIDPMSLATWRAVVFGSLRRPAGGPPAS